MTRKRAAATLSADSSRMTGRIEKPESRGALMWHNAEAVSKSLLKKKEKKEKRSKKDPFFFPDLRDPRARTKSILAN